MQTDSENSNDKEISSPRRPRKDPRNWVTPDAFTLSDEVLDQPLATPKRRGLAMIIDLIVIQQLSQIGSLLLGLSLAGMLFLLGSQKKTKSVGRGFRDYATYLGIAILVGLIGYEIYRVQSGEGLQLVRSSAETERVTIDESLPVERQLAIAKERIGDLEDEDKDLIELIEQIAEQLGYGFGWAAVYFTMLVYLSNGQTLGKWLCRIKIVQLDGKRIGIWSALGRYGGYAASFVTGLSGFFQIYWDANRQGLHDKVSSTVVICLRRSKRIEKPLPTNQGEQDSSSNS